MGRVLQTPLFCLFIHLANTSTENSVPGPELDVQEVMVKEASSETFLSCQWELSVARETCSAWVSAGGWDSWSGAVSGRGFLGGVLLS